MAQPYESLPLTPVIALGYLVMQPLQFLVPTYLMALGQPPRDNHVNRCVTAWLAVTCFNSAANMVVWVMMGLSAASPIRYLANAAAYSAYLVVLVLAIRYCFEVNLWNALLCATAGYTIQNLGSGLGELVRLLIHATFDTALGDLATMCCSNVAVFSIILLCYVVFVRQARSVGRLGNDARGMLGMLMLVIMVIITFDVVIRGLERNGAVFGFLFVLRVVHVAVCVFVLYAEMEALVRAYLRGEVAMARQLSAERERQYELSRETIAAVNRRVHDIRHQVLRELDGTDVDRATLAEVARDIDVYGPMVNTGHEALDTILTEKSLVCQREGIALSCIADGSALAWMGAADLYALFADVIDATLDEVRTLGDADLRTVSLVLRRAGSLAMLHVECFADGRRFEEDERLVEARLLAERLGGSLAVASHGATYSIDVMLPASQ